MISLIEFFSTFLVPLLTGAWILGWTARLLKSPRGKFKLGLLAAALTVALSIVFLLVASAVAARSPALHGAVVFLGLIELGVDYLILKRVFSLSIGRAFALLGVYLVWCFAQFALTLGVYRPFVSEAFIITTASMSPTLVPGDRIFANKLEHPRRWDLVFYHPPQADGTVSGEVYCKRLVGLPGERLRFEGGNLYVNDRLLALPAVVAGRYTFNHYGAQGRDGQTITLASDQRFLIGDNVNKSYDSRFAGPSKQSAVVGVADLRYWPPGRFELLR